MKKSVPDVNFSKFIEKCPIKRRNLLQGIYDIINRGLILKITTHYF